MTQLHIWLRGGHCPQMERTFFRADGYNVECACIRGKTSGAYRNFGTFQWTAAVQAFAILVLRTLLVERFEKSGISGISGEGGTLASSLDYAISKQPQWMVDMFGIYSDGRPIAQRLFRRTNPERKKGGEVVIALNTSFLPVKGIRVFLGADEVTTVEECEHILTCLEDALKIQGHTEKETNTRSVLLSHESSSLCVSPKRVAFLPFHISPVSNGVEEVAREVAERLIISLSQVKGIVVLSPEPVGSSHPTSVSIQEGMRQLPDVLLSGSVRQTDSMVAIFIQMVQSSSGAVLSAKRCVTSLVHLREALHSMSEVLVIEIQDKLLYSDTSQREGDLVNVPDNQVENASENSPTLVQKRAS